MKKLLVCCDHDPGGLSITDNLRSNLRNMAGAVARDLGVDQQEIKDLIDGLNIDRFGLNADFIDRELGDVWIDNLETASGKRLDDPKHPDHKKPYVQDYIREFGVKKCEANALVVNPEAGRRLVRDAILRYVDADAPADYEERLEPERDELREALARRFRL